MLLEAADDVGHLAHALGIADGGAAKLVDDVDLRGRAAGGGGWRLAGGWRNGWLGLCYTAAASGGALPPPHPPRRKHRRRRRADAVSASSQRKRASAPIDRRMTLK